MTGSGSVLLTRVGWSLFPTERELGPGDTGLVNSMLRVYRYFGVFDRDGDPHYDMGLLTLIPKSSSPGLEIRPELTRTWTKIEQVRVSSSVSLLGRSALPPRLEERPTTRWTAAASALDCAPSARSLPPWLALTCLDLICPSAQPSARSARPCAALPSPSPFTLILTLTDHRPPITLTLTFHAHPHHHPSPHLSLFTPHTSPSPSPSPSPTPTPSPR